MSKLSGTLQILRKIQSNLTQENVASKIGVSTSAYAMYERGEREPDVNTLIKLADFYNVSIDYLVGRSAKSMEVKEGFTVDYILEADLTEFAEKLKKNKDLQSLCQKLAHLSNSQIKLLLNLVEQMK